MKKNIYYSVLTAAVVGVIGLVSVISVNQETVYQPREKAQENTQKCLFIYQTPLIKSELKEHNAE